MRTQVREAVVRVCRETALLPALEALAPTALEAAHAYAELVSLGDVGDTYCAEPTFLCTVMALVDSPFAALRRVAMKIIYTAVQPQGDVGADGDAGTAGRGLVRATLVSGLPRKTVAGMCEPVISACLCLLRGGAPNPAFQDTDTSTDRAQWAAALQGADGAVLSALLVEAVVIVTALFDAQSSAPPTGSAAAASAVVTDDEARALAVVCEGLVEVAVAQPAASALAASLWAALRRVSEIRHCAVVLAGPRLVATLMGRVRAPSGTAAEARFAEVVDPLETLAHISAQCPEEFSAGLTADQSTLSCLFALLKRATAAATATAAAAAAAAAARRAGTGQVADADDALRRIERGLAARRAERALASALSCASRPEQAPWRDTCHVNNPFAHAGWMAAWDRGVGEGWEADGL